MTIQRLQARRLIAAGAFAAMATLAPAAAIVTSAPSAQPLANCPNGPGVIVGKQGVGAYTTNCDLVVTATPGDRVGTERRRDHRVPRPARLPVGIRQQPRLGERAQGRQHATQQRPAKTRLLA